MSAALNQVDQIEKKLKTASGSRRNRKELLWHIPLVIASIVTLFPFYAMVIISLRPGQPIELPGSLIPTGLSLDSYAEALASDRIFQWTINSTIYSVTSVFLVLLFASMAGYAFAKKRFIGRDAIFWVFLAMLMVPGHLTLIPLFLIVTNMNGLNTMWGVLVPTLANAQAMFLMRQFIMDIPKNPCWQR
ncbi:carbohydrate ABC transporter permease [Parenemella sanctibonifatiensis]|uniref:Uncharacterized protein n=1 Tax=Parenemella sanctibonifatiensis TaxID=2016505 RepID=A0A255EGV4_9ACTN|nr:carbohydrate ABC transporter permease [Parenemella sanctibonifatiensis]OYN88835.1 hypothetical protein CGZ92_03785 [Parenemella sanctibonifatiensis]